MRCIMNTVTFQSGIEATVVILLAGATYFSWEASGTARVLGKVRKELLKGIGEPPLTGESEGDLTHASQIPLVWPVKWPLRMAARVSRMAATVDFTVTPAIRF